MVYDKLRDQSVVESAQFIERESSIQNSIPHFFDSFHDVISFVSEKLISGDIYEFGVAEGATIVQLSRQFPNRRIIGFDNFQGLPEDWPGTKLKRGAFKVNALPSFPHNVEIVVGDIHQTAPNGKYHSIAFVHVDVELFSTGLSVFNALKPNLKRGTLLLIDDFHSYPFWQQGLAKAFAQVFSRDSFEYIAFGPRQALVQFVI